MTIDELDKVSDFLFKKGYWFVKTPDWSVRFKPWYAYKDSDVLARMCEKNRRCRIQIVIEPCSPIGDGPEPQRFVMEITGEAKGIWWDLKGYSFSVEDVLKRFDDIERSLVSAWNALTQIVPPSTDEVV